MVNDRDDRMESIVSMRLLELPIIFLGRVGVELCLTAQRGANTRDWRQLFGVMLPDDSLSIPIQTIEVGPNCVFESMWY